MSIAVVASLGISSVASAEDVQIVQEAQTKPSLLRVAVQASFGTATIGRGEKELDFLDAELPQSDFGVGAMGQVLFRVIDGFHIGPYFDYKTSKYAYTEQDDYLLKVPAIGVVNRVSLLPVILQVSLGYSFGSAEQTVFVANGEPIVTGGDLIGLQAQFWLAYEIPVNEWFSIDVAVFFTYDGMNFKDDFQPGRDIKKGPEAQTLTYKTFGLGAQLNFDIL